MTDKNYRYIIVGGGVAASFAGKELRKADENASILILTDEAYGPYKRPTLSKDLWTEDVTLDSIFYKINTDETITIKTNTSVNSIDRLAKTVTTANGEEYHYDKLILATGGSPRMIAGPESERVLTYRTLDDYKHLQMLCANNRTALVVGGGFIATEIAAALAENDISVSLVYPDKLLAEKMFPTEIAESYTQSFRDHDVKLINNSRLLDYSIDNDKVNIHTDKEQTFSADFMVCGLGITPNTQLAEAAGLAVEDGIRVNSYFQSSDPDIYAVGDVANFPDERQGRNRIEHEDHARVSARKAARNASGSSEAYHYIPLFYSDLFDIGFEGYGQLDARLDTVIEPLDGGKMVYYLDGDKPQAFLSWNVYPNRKQIRSFLKENKINPDDVKGTVSK